MMTLVDVYYIECIYIYKRRSCVAFFVHFIRHKSFTINAFDENIVTNGKVRIHSFGELELPRLAVPGTENHRI